MNTRMKRKNEMAKMSHKNDEHVMIEELELRFKMNKASEYQLNGSHMFYFIAVRRS